MRVLKIKFSRHAKRRARLYKISEAAVIDILANMNLRHGEHDLIINVASYQYPLKIVVVIEKDIATVVTNYPLKKGRKK